MKIIAKVIGYILELPIFEDLKRASKHHWLEALKELSITLFFSLMPIWLGCVIVVILTIPDTPITFLRKFAASSDLALISASVIGPLLYIIFNTSKRDRNNKLTFPFPSGLWFIMIIFLLCIISTVVYCFTYVSETNTFFDADGKTIPFTKENIVMWISIVIFSVSIFLVLSATVIRNSIGNPATLMSKDTNAFVEKFKENKTVSTGGPGTDTDDFVKQMKGDSPKPTTNKGTE